MTNVIVTVDGNIDGALRRLKKAAATTGLLADIRRHSHYLKPGETQRLKSKRARARLAKTARRQQAGEAARLQRLGTRE